MTTPEQREEMIPLIERITRYQGATTDKKWCARWGRYLGTQDVWARRMKAGLLDELDGSKWLPLLRELAATLDGAEINGPVYDTLPFTKTFLHGIEKLTGSKSDRRIFVCLAAMGVGKSVAAHLAIREATERNFNGVPRSLIVVPKVWCEKRIAILTGLCRAMGITPPESGANSAFDSLVVALRQCPRLIIFDEAHQGGTALMTILKDLVNATDSFFAYVGLPTEFRRVASGSTYAMIEARQFMRRCMYPIFDSYAGGTKAVVGKENNRPGDIEVFLAEAVGMDKARELARKMEPALCAHGNISTLADIVEHARTSAEGAQPSADELDAARVEICREANPTFKTR